MRCRVASIALAALIAPFVVPLERFLPEFTAQASAALGQPVAIDSIALRLLPSPRAVLADVRIGKDRDVEIDAKKWKLPAGAPLLVESLKNRGTLRQSTLEVPALEGRLYGGRLVGSLKADWTKQFRIGGGFDVSGLDIAALQAALGKKPAVTGRLDAKGWYSASAGTMDRLAGAIVVDGLFKVHQGALQGFDLSQMVNVITGKVSGGQTRFDELSGRIALRGKRARIHEFCARSSVLTAGGAVEKSPDDHLSGRLDVSISGSRGWVGVPVAMGGTLANPTVTPTRAATIGAVVGTVLLPGIGTTLGARAGAATENIRGCR